MSIIIYKDGELGADCSGVITSPLSGEDRWYRAEKLFVVNGSYAIASVGSEIDWAAPDNDAFLDKITEALKKHDREPYLNITIPGLPEKLLDNSFIVMTKRKVYTVAKGNEKNELFLQVYTEPHPLYHGSEIHRVEILLQEGFSIEQCLHWVLTSPGSTVNYGYVIARLSDLVTFETRKRQLRREKKKKAEAKQSG